VLVWLSTFSEVQTWSGCCHCHLLSLAPLNPDWFYVFSTSSPGLSRTKGREMAVVKVHSESVLVLCVAGHIAGRDGCLHSSRVERQ